MGLLWPDKIAPFVVINEKDSRAAWSFTLLHELAHILLGETGISGYDRKADIEKFCDTLLLNFSLTHQSWVKFSLEINPIQLGDKPNARILSERVSTFSTLRNLSQKMVAYNLLRANLIAGAVYQELAAIFDGERRQRKEESENEGGPSYYVVRRHRLGSGLISSVNRMISAGALSTPKAGLVLGVKPTAVYQLIGQDKAA